MIRNRFPGYLVALLLVSMGTNAPAQVTQGRWGLSVLGGTNYWLNDASTKKLGGGGDLGLRYGITPQFSLGISGGYHVYKAEQEPAIIPPYDYYYAETIPVALVGYFHFIPGGNVNPYLYVGAGGMTYVRKTWTREVLPAGDNWQFGYMIPAGFGLDAFVSKSVAFTVNLGFRMFDDKVDLIPNGGLEGALVGTAGFTFYLGDSDQDDEDGDGLTTAQERRAGTNQRLADTDRDGISDGDELRKYRTNPIRQDTDGDGIPDGEEIAKTNTDPTKYDTDGDLISDGDEILTRKTDPLRPDTDGDRLNDGDEIRQYRTDPLRVDTDGDGLSDSDEVQTVRTDPTNPDSDGDGLSDGDEVRRYKTDPMKADTDGGGLQDGPEVAGGKKPLDPSDDGGATVKLERGKFYVLEGVNFTSGSAELTVSSVAVLEKAFQSLQSQPTLKVEIAGYTDSMGDRVLNERLSLRRAEVVKDWLKKRGIPVTRMTAVGKGPREPIASNSTADGRARNRRIEFHVK